MAALPELRLKRNQDRRLRRGHLWIYSNEVDVQATPLKGLEPGCAVQVTAADKRPVGVAVVNPNTLLCGRLLSRNPDAEIGEGLFSERVRRARALRTGLFPDTGAGPCYRLMHGDADGLGGVVVDQFGDVLVVQIATLAMEQRKELLLTALDEVLAPRAVVLKNDGVARELEGLPKYQEVVRGSIDGPVRLRENGVDFLADVAGGQKTGWFYDHRDNRARVQRLVRDMAGQGSAADGGVRVLDVFTYAGAFGVQAAVAGAAEVVCTDSSAPALERVGEHAAMNAVADRVSTLEGDADKVLGQLQEAEERFDVVVLDPPALIRRKKDSQAGQEAYRRLNARALALLADNGVLASASCSFHLGQAEHAAVVRAAARKHRRELRIVARGGAGGDHPVHPFIPETEYLKCLFLKGYP